MTSFITLRANGAFCMVRGSPRMCIRISGTRRRAATLAMRRSSVQAGDVVDDLGAGTDGEFRDGGFAGVDREMGILEVASKPFQDGSNLRRVFGDRCLFRARTC